MTVSELIVKLKDCAPGAEVTYDGGHVGSVDSDATTVYLCADDDGAGC